MTKHANHYIYLREKKHKCTSGVQAICKFHDPALNHMALPGSITNITRQVTCQ